MSTSHSQRRPIFARVDTWSQAEVLWFSQSALIGSVQSQPLPTAWATGSQGLSSPPCFGPRASLCKWVSPPPSSPSIYPVPPRWQTAPEPICVCKCLGLGTSLNILHVSTKRSPFAPAGRDEGVPLLWPMKPSGSRYLRLYIQFPSSIISEGDR